MNIVKRIEEMERAYQEGSSFICNSKEDKDSFLDLHDDADIISEEELKSICRGMENIKTEKFYRMDSWESLDSFIDRIEHV